MKLYIVADMEGIAGVVADVQTGGASSYFEAARLQYTREIRSVCEAALSAGAEEVYVNDFHGNGLTLITDQLPREVMVIRGGFRPTSGYDLLDSTFTGLVLLGIHARSGTYGGVL
ncbi:MAG TPA: M55 family metallopeptidase, partial [Candidatus Rifleibacterium sp.]|nr:M55 family metallopeptidase [Candidatus Rifleibacterium sp.]